MKKLIVFYLKKMLEDSLHQEESLEVNADLIQSANEKWQKQRQQSDALRVVLKILAEPNCLVSENHFG